MPRWHQTPDAARRMFLADVTHARDRPFVSADPDVLLAAAELHNKPVADEVTRMEAVPMMQRNLARSLATASLAALVDCATGYRPPVAPSSCQRLPTAPQGQRGGRDTTGG